MIQAKQGIRANLRIDSRKSGHRMPRRFPSKEDHATQECQSYPVACPAAIWLGSPFFREKKLNPNIFFSNFSGAAGISRQNPGISRQKSLISLVSRDISNFLGPTRSRGRPPPHPENIRTQKFLILRTPSQNRSSL